MIQVYQNLQIGNKASYTSETQNSASLWMKLFLKKYLNENHSFATYKAQHPLEFKCYNQCPFMNNFFSYILGISHSF